MAFHMVYVMNFNFVGLYERGVAECPLDSSLWIEYLHYVTNSLKMPEPVLNVAERATRNCPWVIETWTEYLIAAERFAPEKLVGRYKSSVITYTFFLVSFIP